MVPADSHRISRVPRYSGTRIRVRSSFAYVAVTPYGSGFHRIRLEAGLVTLRFYTDARPTTPQGITPPRFGLFRVRSPLLAESLLIYFPPGTEMVHFPGFARTRLCIQRAVSRLYRDWFPYSEILGSKPIAGSPRLIAGNHVLHRLLAPRHPPYALSSLTIKPAQHTPNRFLALTQLYLSTKFRRHRTIQLSKIIMRITKQPAAAFHCQASAPWAASRIQQRLESSHSTHLLHPSCSTSTLLTDSNALQRCPPDTPLRAPHSTPRSSF